jgi:4-deoxy-L-threo-5-hexosulose-uronate ketol-isomerase
MTTEELRASCFAERCELDILNIDGPGSVTMNETKCELSTLDGLYVRRGVKHISFRSSDPSNIAEFYLLSCPPHTSYPVSRIAVESIEPAALRSPETANHQRIQRYIHVPRRLGHC